MINHDLNKDTLLKMDLQYFAMPAAQHYLHTGTNKPNKKQYKKNAKHANKSDKSAKKGSSSNSDSSDGPSASERLSWENGTG